MQSVCVTFPFLAPLAEGPVDIGPDAKGGQAFSLLLEDGASTLPDAAPPEVVLSEPATVTVGLVPPQYWPVALPPMDTGPPPKIAPPAVGAVEVETLPQGSSDGLAEVVTKGQTDAAAAGLAAAVSMVDLMGKALLPTDLDAGEGEAKMPGALSDAGTVDGGGRTDRKAPDGNATASLDLISLAKSQPGIQPLPDKPSVAAPRLAIPDLGKKETAGDHRPIPSILAPDSRACPELTGPGTDWTEPPTPNADVEEPRQAAGLTVPEEPHNAVRHEIAPWLQKVEPPLLGKPESLFDAGRTSVSAITPEALQLAIPNPDAPSPQPQSFVGIWERIVFSLSEATGSAGPKLGPEDAPAGPILVSGDIGGPFDPVLGTVTESVRLAAPLRAVDPGMAPQPLPAPLLWPSPMASAAILPSLIVDAFDPSEPPDEDTTIFASAMPAIPSYATTGTPTAATPIPVSHLAAQIGGALGRSADGATELALSPAELGHVRLRLEPDATNPDRMVVMISFERPETLDLFRRHSGDLAEAIRAAGYSGADIGFAQHGSGQGLDRNHQPPEAGFAARSDDPTPAPAAPRLAAGTSLDLRL